MITANTIATMNNTVSAVNDNCVKDAGIANDSYV